MTPNEKRLEDALQEAKAIARRTDLNDEERADLKARMEKIETIRDDIKNEKSLRDMVVAEIGADAYKAARKTLGEGFVESDAYKLAKAGGFRGLSEAYEFKAEPTQIDEGTALANLLVAQRVNTIEPIVTMAPRVADLIPSIAASSNAVSYYTETSETSSIAPVLEGNEKPNFTLAGAVVTDEIEVIAGFAAITQQALEDVPFLAGFVNQRLTRALKRVEEDQILNGNATNPNLNGILNRTTSTQAQGTDTAFDAIYKAADKAETAGGYAPDGVVMHPDDWQPLALAKDQNDRYYGTGPFAAAVGPTVWGLKVVKSNLIAAKTVLVGSFGEAAFLARKGGLAVRTSDSHSDYFKKNKVAVLIEERVGLGVPQPLAFTKLTLV